MSDYVNDLMAEVRAKNPSEAEFHQAVLEVAESLALVLDRATVKRQSAGLTLFLFCKMLEGFSHA